jgi:hypothetical protein
MERALTLKVTNRHAYFQGFGNGLPSFCLEFVDTKIEIGDRFVDLKRKTTKYIFNVIERAITSKMAKSPPACLRSLSHPLGPACYIVGSNQSAMCSPM